jgi:hypothetical protein
MLYLTASAMIHILDLKKKHSRKCCCKDYRLRGTKNENQNRYNSTIVLRAAYYLLVYLA